VDWNGKSTGRTRCAYQGTPLLVQTPRSEYLTGAPCTVNPNDQMEMDIGEESVPSVHSPGGVQEVIAAVFGMMVIAVVYLLNSNVWFIDSATLAGRSAGTGMP
jgi:hypothetical protein